MTTQPKDPAWMWVVGFAADLATASAVTILCPRGFLGLGAKETLAFCSHVTALESFAREERIDRVR